MCHVGTPASVLEIWKGLDPKLDITEAWNTVMTQTFFKKSYSWHTTSAEVVQKQSAVAPTCASRCRAWVKIIPSPYKWIVRCNVSGRCACQVSCRTYVSNVKAL